MEIVRTYTSKYNIGDIVLVDRYEARHSGIGKVIDIGFDEKKNEECRFTYTVEYVLFCDQDRDPARWGDFAERNILAINEGIKKLFC